MQGTNGAQLLAGVIPQPNTALGMTGLGRPVVPGTAGTAALPYAQTLSQLQGKVKSEQAFTWATMPKKAAHVPSIDSRLGKSLRYAAASLCVVMSQLLR